MRYGGRVTDTDQVLTIRPAMKDDAAAIAAVYLASFAATYDFPMAHSAKEVRAWVRKDMLPQLDVWVADQDDRVVGFIACSPTTVEQLYIDPEHTGGGIGSFLLRTAKDHRLGGLDLWTFQVNDGARRFYARHGFTEVELTDGSGNEEGQPDVRLVWATA